MEKRLPLLMTASVSTRGMKGACFSDEERENMYAGALAYYITTLLQNPEQTIVFAENSGWNLESLKRKLPPPYCQLSERLEFISFPPDAFDINKGKGYNEMLMINMVVDRSEAIRQAGGFFKVTGRYPIYNIDYFIGKASRWILEKGNDLYADVKDHSLYDMMRLGWCGHSFECRLFGVSLGYYQTAMREIYAECDDYSGNLLEHRLFEMQKHGRSPRMHLRFPREPHFGGLEGSEISAMSFTKEQDSLKGKIKRGVGNGIRMFMPWFWF